MNSMKHFNWRPWNVCMLVCFRPLKGTNDEAVEYLWFVALSARIMNHPTKKRSCQSVPLLLRRLYLRQTPHHWQSWHLFHIELWLGKRYSNGSDSYFLFFVQSMPVGSYIMRITAHSGPVRLLKPIKNWEGFYETLCLKQGWFSTNI